jgi:hypothetical protein
MHMHQNILFLIPKNFRNIPKHNPIDSKNNLQIKFLLKHFFTSELSIDKRGTRVCNVPLIARINSCVEQAVDSYHQANKDG